MSTNLERPGGPDGAQQPSVGFTAMADGTAEDYRLLGRYEDAELARFPDRVLSWLRDMDDHGGYQITRLQHCLQAATRAYRAGEDEEMVVCVLVHDIGDMLGPANHSEVAAAVLRPYVSERNYWVVKHHGVFQGAYWFHHVGADPHARERWAGHPWYQDCVDFCAHYDQNSFDPNYPTETLEFFEPMLRRVFAPERVKAPDLQDPDGSTPAES
ncbi:HD domain-containing protein [Saccharopolyspora cebuensis]|uniref:HD domain-containing protein n=1 Tax=Saccharopolyspora cebuensis TaxID=418759 RepID=A0ABV4CCE0_9PSEU